MIDEKKIEEAARAYILSKHAKERAYFQLKSIEDFKQGARWAIQDYLKNLWHSNSDKPEKNKICLVEVSYRINHGLAPDEKRIEQSSYHDFGWYNCDFKYIGNDYTIIRWCYLGDLLTK